MADNAVGSIMSLVARGRVPEDTTHYAVGTVELQPIIVSPTTCRFGLTGLADSLSRLVLDVEAKQEADERGAYGFIKNIYLRYGSSVIYTFTGDQLCELHLAREGAAWEQRSRLVTLPLSLVTVISGSIGIWLDIDFQTGCAMRLVALGVIVTVPDREKLAGQYHQRPVTSAIGVQNLFCGVVPNTGCLSIPFFAHKQVYRIVVRMDGGGNQVHGDLDGEKVTLSRYPKLPIYVLVLCVGPDPIPSKHVFEQPAKEKSKIGCIWKQLQITLRPHTHAHVWAVIQS